MPYQPEPRYATVGVGRGGMGGTVSRPSNVQNSVPAPGPAPASTASNIKYNPPRGTNAGGGAAADNSGQVNNPGGGAGSNIYDWTQPQDTVGRAGLPGNVNPAFVASERTPFEFPTPQNSYSQQELLTNFFNVNPSTGRVDTPNYATTTQAPGIQAPALATQDYAANTFANDALTRKMNMTAGDFGIPDSVQETMKVKAAQQVNSAKEAQKAAARRQLASMGLLNDSASFNADQMFDQQANQNIFNQYSNIDTENAIERNKQFQQNLQEVLSGGLKAGDQEESFRKTNLEALQNAITENEKGRQFNITSNLDQDRLRNATGEWLENTQQKRATLTNDIAKWLEDYQLRRLGLINKVQADSADNAVRDQGGLDALMTPSRMSAFQTGG
jgi:hypothetical protein